MTTTHAIPSMTGAGRPDSGFLISENGNLIAITAKAFYGNITQEVNATQLKQLVDALSSYLPKETK